MNTLHGDLIKLAEQGHFDVIVHGANCYNTMGAGIAAQIKKKYPEAFEADMKTVCGSISKLGSYSHADIEYGDHNFTIINAYTQHGFSDGFKDVFEYNSFGAVLRKIGVAYAGKRIGLPLIGCGLAGGDSARILKIIKNFTIEFETTGGTVTIVIFNK